jgi:hypothetical protein
LERQADGNIPGELPKAAFPEFRAFGDGDEEILSCRLYGSDLEQMATFICRPEANTVYSKRSPIPATRALTVPFACSVTTPQLLHATWRISQAGTKGRSVIAQHSAHSAIKSAADLRSSNREVEVSVGRHRRA